ncbi:MAG: GTPase domain-containing protein, partial [Promethearchaeota archaeon]
MGNKILITGEGNVGKTTLIRIFFEGKNALNLLKNPLEPTMGIETVIPSFDNNLGVFDIPGQNFLTYISTATEVFKESDVILLLLDCKKSFEENHEIITKIGDIRDKECGHAKIFALFHKIDLLSIEELTVLEQNVENLRTTNLIPKLNLHISSIVREYQIPMLSIITKVIKTAYQADEAVKAGLDMIQSNGAIFHALQDLHKATLLQLYEATTIPSQLLQNILFLFEKNKLILKFIEKQAIYYSLSEKGQIFINKFSNYMESFIGRPSIEASLKELPIDTLPTEDVQNFTRDLIHGFMIMDSKGKMLFLEELNQKPILDQLGAAVSDATTGDNSVLASYLIALIEFSPQFKIKMEQGFNLEREKLRITIIRRQQLFFVCYHSTSIEAQLIFDSFMEWVNYFRTNFQSEIKDFLTDGKIGNFQAFREYFQTSLSELVPKILQRLKQQELASIPNDIEYYQKIYVQLDLNVAPTHNLKPSDLET